MNIVHFIYRHKYLILCLLLLLPSGMKAAENHEETKTGGGVDVKEIVFGHTSDAYEWHITTIGDRHISIPLPVILYSERVGWTCFSSAKLEHGHASYNGFYIAKDAPYDGKICEDINGEKVRPVDISITKNVVQLWIVVALMLVIFLYCARWYKHRKPGDESPRGFVGFIEMFVMMINDDVIKNSIGEKHYKFYSPYLLTAFFFIFISNVLGLVPIFPGGANLTGNITITFFLSICTFLAINLFGNKEYWKEIFWPNVPLWLKIPIPMMPVIEFFGILTKPFALMVRLFANMLAGHAIVLSLTCVIFIACSFGAVVGASLSFVSVLMTIFMDCLELLVAFIQAYVFTMLSAVFIGLAHQEEHS